MTVFWQDAQNRPFSSGIMAAQFSWQGFETVRVNFFMCSVSTGMHHFNRLHKRCESIFLLIFKTLAFFKKIAPTPATDEDLVGHFWSTGELSALGNLYSRYMEMLYGICLNYLKNPDEAQDAVMAIFEELITKLRQHEVSNFKSWLYTLAKNHCLMKLRSGKKMQTTNFSEEFMQSAEDGHLENVLNREEHFQQLEDCMDLLAEGQRTAIEAFYLRGKCYNEICAETGLEWKQVRSAIQNGRRNLKICMEEQKVKANE